MFRNPADLSLRNGQMVIYLREEDREVTRPIEDIGVVVIENQMVKASIPLLNALTENNVAVVLCDAHSMPCSMLTTLDANTTLQETYRYQIDASLPQKKRAWQQIVEGKIRNQSQLLSKLGKDGDMLKPYYSNVKSGDSDNKEGAAARLYWSQMFYPGFKRERYGDVPNALLNYGYTILRAATARALLGSGLYPAFGIFHRNRYNAFPLADDVMEPYRPFVDEIVARIYVEENHSLLTTEVKQYLQRVLFADVVIGKQMRPLEVALSSTTASLAHFLKGETTELVIPKFP